LELNLSGSRLNLRVATAPALALSPVRLSWARLSLARLSMVWPGLFLPRIGRPVLMLAAGSITWLRQS